MHVPLFGKGVAAQEGGDAPVAFVLSFGKACTYGAP